MKLCGETFLDTLSSKSSFLVWSFSWFQEQWLKTTGRDVSSLIQTTKNVPNGIHTIQILSMYSKISRMSGKQEISKQKTTIRLFWSNTRVILQRSRLMNALMLGSRFRKMSICHHRTHSSIKLTRCFITRLSSKFLYSSKSSTWLTQERSVMVRWMSSQASSTTRCSSLSFS